MLYKTTTPRNDGSAVDDNFRKEDSLSQTARDGQQEVPFVVDKTDLIEYLTTFCYEIIKVAKPGVAHT